MLLLFWIYFLCHFSAFEEFFGKYSVIKLSFSTIVLSLKGWYINFDWTNDWLIDRHVWLQQLGRVRVWMSDFDSLLRFLASSLEGLIRDFHFISSESSSSSVSLVSECIACVTELFGVEEEWAEWGVKHLAIVVGPLRILKNFFLSIG